MIEIKSVREPNGDEMEAALNRCASPESESDSAVGRLPEGYLEHIRNRFQTAD